VRAFDIAARYGGSVLWIHGPQPLDSGPNTEQLLQVWERDPESVNIAQYVTAPASAATKIHLARLEPFDAPPCATPAVGFICVAFGNAWLRP